MVCGNGGVATKRGGCRDHKGGRERGEGGGGGGGGGGGDRGGGW